MSSEVTSASAAANRVMHASTAPEWPPAQPSANGSVGEHVERPGDLGVEVDRRQRHVRGVVDVAVLGEFGIDHVKFQNVKGVVGGGRARSRVLFGRWGHDQ